MTPYRTAVQTDDASFERDVIASPLPVLVAFGADWSDLSQRMLPVLHKLAIDYVGKYKVVTIDVARSPQLAKVNGVHVLPTVMVFKAGYKVVLHTGTADEKLLLRFLGEGAK